MIKAYKLKSDANTKKIKKVKETLHLYRKDAQKIAKLQWQFFNRTNKFDKQSKLNIKLNLSARYGQTCQYQVVGMLQSHLSNLQNAFAEYVYKSSLTPEIKHQMNLINRRYLWNCQEHKDFQPEELWLARKILKGVRKRYKNPTYKNINMALDTKVAEISVSTNSFDYWIRFSTSDKGKPICLPIKSNKYFENATGKRKNFCQINVDRDGELGISFIKENSIVKKYDAERDKIAIDFGLVTLFSDNRGGLYGKSFFEILRDADKQISGIAKKNIQKTGKVRSKKYDKVVKKFRETFKNEISRVINRIISVNKPAEIILESLNFKSQALSKRMNRILSNYGRKFIKAKLERLTEEFGIKITYMNAAYTSQECSRCGYIDKRNRKSQSKFLCVHCGLKINADVNASRVILARSSCKSANIFLSKQKVLRIRIEKFLSHTKCANVCNAFVERSRIQDGTCYHSLTNKLADNVYSSVYKEIAVIVNILL